MLQTPVLMRSAEVFSRFSRERNEGIQRKKTGERHGDSLKIHFALFEDWFGETVMEA